MIISDLEENVWTTDYADYTDFADNYPFNTPNLFRFGGIRTHQWFRQESAFPQQSCGAPG
ncbi:hypothetical protein CEE37_10705 [candidate division LCP-89 bacterium B3_LCP]|uniref:Uncharacterized protein n=1 Tax=candidate division LCP-89 bacterium B3_LCP TaxID=2012998 RepID=A0A532UXW4_UNCL8|nr:MAG: hypothetical protein CEE37_10705 [candidate division LCP-89 bacterium B3_LCP]